MRDAIKSSREGGWYNAYTGPASTLAFRNGWLISHGRAPKKRFASTRRGVLFLFLFLSLSLSLSPTSRTGLFSVLSCGSLWLACAVICATERVGYLIKIGLFSCIPVHALPEKTLSPLAHSLSLSFSFSPSLWDSAALSIRLCGYPPPDTRLRVFLPTFFRTPFLGKYSAVERKLRERVSRARSGSERFTGDRILTLKLGNLAELFELTSTIPSPPLLLCTIVKNAAR